MNERKLDLRIPFGGSGSEYMMSEPGLLLAILEESTADTTLAEPARWRERIALLDHLERLLLDPTVTDAVLLERAHALQARLDDANALVFETIRADIRRGDRQALRRWLPPGTDADFDAGHPEAYDDRDAIVAGVLQVEEPGPTHVERSAEMVFYQPTPTRQVLDLIDRLPMSADDVFVDIGSGLGHVPMLVSICTGVRSIGVEIEPAYVAAARSAAETLELRDVTFIEADAREASLDGGTVFFMYTPFTGAMLHRVLDRLHEQARRREIRVCAFGPFVPTVAAESWLMPMEPVRDGRVAIFRSRATH